MSGVDSFLLSELNVLATEAKKKHVNVKEAADKAIGTLRALKATASEKSVGVADGAWGADQLWQRGAHGGPGRNRGQ